MINESGLTNDAFMTDDIAFTEVENGQTRIVPITPSSLQGWRDIITFWTKDKSLLSSIGALRLAREIEKLVKENARLKAEIFTIAQERDEARDEVVAACRGTQMDEAAIASMWQYVREKVAIQDERDALAARVQELEARIAYCSGSCKSDAVIL